MATMLSWKWKEEPVSPAGFPDFDSEFDNTWGLFEDDEVQQEKPQITEHKQEKPEPSRAELASKLLQEIDEYIKEGKNYSTAYNIELKNVKSGANFFNTTGIIVNIH